MISAWQIYWVLQLDSIGTLAALLTVGTIVIGLGALLVVAMQNDFDFRSDLPTKEARFAVAKSTARRCAIAGVVFATLSALIPTSKTAAAMIVLPAIANNETIRAEAGDLYALAKDALKQAVAPSHDEKPEK